jgi:hypothetical protein
VRVLVTVISEPSENGTSSTALRGTLDQQSNVPSEVTTGQCFLVVCPPNVRHFWLAKAHASLPATVQSPPKSIPGFTPQGPSRHRRRGS